MKSSFFFTSFYAAWEGSRKWHPAAWLAFHLAIGLAFLLCARVAVNTDIYSILPDSNSSRIVARAEQKMSAGSGGGFYVLVGNPDFGLAKAAAGRWYTAVKDHGGLDSLSFEVNAATLGSFQDYLFENRYRLVPDATLAALERGDSQSIAASALQTLSSPLSVGALNHIDQDPFLLSWGSLQAFLGSGLLSGMAVGVKDDVLAAEKDGIWWVLVSGKVKGNGIATDTEGHVVPILRTQADVTAQAVAGTRFVMSGVPFHAYESSSGAQAEFSVIGTVSTVMHCLIVILAFWTLAPLVLTLGSMAMGVLAGLSATFIAFGEVHIFTLVFGTTLIGVSIDYALYYFAEWLNPWAPGDGRSVIKRILPGISLGLVTSVISFLVLCFVPFPLLRQMAIFSTVGLLSTYLSVLLIFPRFKPPKRLAGRLDISRNRPVRMAEALMGLYRRFFALPAWTRWASLALLAAVTVLGLTRVDMDNNLRSIYKVSPAMAANEKEAAEILQHGSTGMYFIVKGATPEETRQREEALTARLASGTAEKKLKSWLGLTLLLPSERRQDRTWQAAGKTLMPAIDEQMRLLDFDQTAAEAVRGDWKAQEGRHIDPEAFAQLPFAGMVGSLWIGEVDSHWFSAVMLMGVQDKAFIRGLEKEVEGVYLINKAEDIANVLQDLSQAALLIVAGAYLLIFLGLWWIYDLRSAIRISLVPAAASIMTAAILGFTGLPFNLFAIVGLILVPGIGIDYAIFYKEGSSASSVTMLAIFLTMLSNIMSFGLLGFSSLAAVFGVTVTLGVAISFLLAPLTLPRDVPRGDAQAH